MILSIIEVKFIARISMFMSAIMFHVKQIHYGFDDLAKNYTKSEQKAADDC